MAPPLKGRLESPKEGGRPNYSFRIRVNGRQRRVDLGTADPEAAAQQRDVALAGIKAELAAKASLSGSRGKASVAHVRKVVKHAGKVVRTFPAVAERWWNAQEKKGVVVWKNQRSVLQRFVIPHWSGDVSRYQAQNVASVLREVKGLSRQSRLHVHTAVSGVFEHAILEGLLTVNPCKQVKRSKLVPKRLDDEDPKLRATLLLEEVLTICGWVHPEERHRPATERLQGKLLLAHLLGLRHHEVSSLRWNYFTSDFTFLNFKRAKKKDATRSRDGFDLSQLPELQARLRAWWTAAGKPTAGLLFPAMRDGRHAKAGETQAKGLSEADALRRLYKRAHGIEAQVTRNRVMVDKRVKAGKRTVPVTTWEQVRPLTERERLVLEGSDREAPVCFHASRHAYAQALDAAGLADEQIRELLDHENVRVTQVYLRSIGARAKVVPNVHRLTAGPLSGHIAPEQGGHIESATSEKPVRPSGFEPLTYGSGEFENTTQNAKRRTILLDDAPAALSSSPAFLGEALWEQSLGTAPDVASASLAAALERASAAGQWSVVGALAAELAARRTGH
jgi:integrase